MCGLYSKQYEIKKTLIVCKDLKDTNTDPGK
jgi:hypothetical protein